MKRTNAHTVRNGRAADGANERKRHRHGRAFSRLRFHYFAQAGAPAGRYGVEFNDVIRHLWQVRRSRGRIVLKTVRHLDDLVHVIACRMGISPAWPDFVERYESILVRRCAERLGEMQAILLVRRMFSELRQDAPVGLAAPDDLGGFVGDRPLRTWLSHRALRMLNQRQTAWFAPGDHDAAPGPDPSRWRIRIDPAPDTPDVGDRLPFAVPERAPAGAAGGRPHG